jgi:hypothetical protein
MGPLRSVIYEAKVEAIANHLDRTCRSRILLPAGRWPIVRAAATGDESTVFDSGLRPLLPSDNLSTRRATTHLRAVPIYSAANLRACSHVRSSANLRASADLCTSPTASALPRDIHAAGNLRSADDNASTNDDRAARSLHSAAPRLRLTASRRPWNRSASVGSIRLQFDTVPVRRCSPGPTRYGRSRRG